MHRVVHFDLKGFPLKIPYIEKVILAVKQWGATGILLEWEDTFPYWGDLIDIGSQGPSATEGIYSLDEVRHIIQFAEGNQLEVIQLIQTIGHMEFVLKHEALHYLREAPRSPAALCPSRPTGQALVRAMLRQALDVQPGAKFLHIGADEVWHLAVCELCQQRAVSSEFKCPSLFLQHVAELATWLKQEQAGITVLMWDDMLRSIPADTIRAYKLGELVHPVVWQYSPIECFQLDAALWHNYGSVFPAVWTGSAFKGANGCSQVLSPVGRYVSNHQAWRREMDRYKDSVNFVGVILTGWSRYDHYATLCELLPVSLPSLAACLKTLTVEDYQSLTITSIPEVLPESEWPGSAVWRGVRAFVAARDSANALIHGELVASWMNEWQLKNSYTNPLQIEGIVRAATNLIAELTAIKIDLSVQFELITGKRSAEEWIGTFIAPLVRKMAKLKEAAERKCQEDASITPAMIT